MEKYQASVIEPKWQKYWAEHPELNQAADSSDKPKKYILDMFPYPSGAGLHAGHVESYTATDIVSRYWRLRGFEVMHPQGWDAFGLPAENYAIKTGTHPSITTKEAIKTFTGQLNSLGYSYDWSREVNSSDPEYYRWTQWFFLLLYKNGLAYKSKASVNWCASCQTVLANEQSEGGICERCKNPVVQKDLEQWFFKITDFIESKDDVSGLIDGLENIDWPDSTKAAQRNWIGRSEGAQFKLPVAGSDLALEVYTTRIDTVYGMTYAVVAPEHPLIADFKPQITNWEEAEKYITAAKNKTDLERMETKEKTGVELKGVKVINPFNQREIPLFVADYVLGHYGTGAVMAVPAHDERDYEFARKNNLPIEQSISTDRQNNEKVRRLLEILDEIKQKADEEGISFWVWGGLAGAFHARIVYRQHDDIDLIVSNRDEQDRLEKIITALGFSRTKADESSVALSNSDGIDVELFSKDDPYVQEVSASQNDFSQDTLNLMGSSQRVIGRDSLLKLKNLMITKRNKPKDVLDVAYLNGKVFTDDGTVVASGEYDGLTSADAREKMAAWLEEKGLGSKKVNYKLRDWLVSRQRYWGAPIPIIYCDACGEMPVPEKDLPVLLPTDVDFKPTGESPLAQSKSFHEVKCPQCGAKARRESDTMDTFVCSSWYYLRYADPKNIDVFAAKDKVEKWLPVDLYVGGAEHSVLHLLYSRFFTKVLKSFGYVGFDEPFAKLRHQGTILGEDGRKMSKSLGNVVNPDEYVKEFGADTLRMYEMFMGPLEDMKPWSSQGIIGIERFLEKVWRLRTKADGKAFGESNPKNRTMLHKTVKKVGEDIENLRFNTAISAMMILVNELDKEEKIPAESYKMLILILAPLAPHLAEELWSELGGTESVFLADWPKFDTQFIQDETFKLVVQFNGKTRGTIAVPADIDEVGARSAVERDEKLSAYLSGKEIKKVIFVKGRLINFVVV